MFDVKRRHQWRSQLDNWGGGGNIHIFVFCDINFFWNWLFLWSVNMNIWIWAPQLSELATPLGDISFFGHVKSLIVYISILTYLTSTTVFFVPPNNPKMHCDLFWEKANMALWRITRFLPPDTVTRVRGKIWLHSRLCMFILILLLVQWFKVTVFRLLCYFFLFPRLLLCAFP